MGSVAAQSTGAAALAVGRAPSQVSAVGYRTCLKLVFSLSYRKNVFVYQGYRNAKYTHVDMQALRPSHLVTSPLLP